MMCLFVMACANTREVGVQKRSVIGPDREEPLILTAAGVLYPDIEEEGEVRLKYTVDIHGRVKDVKVVTTNLPSEFVKNSLKAFKYFKYLPRVRNGKPEEVKGVVWEFWFRLNHGFDWGGEKQRKNMIAIVKNYDPNYSEK